MAHLGPSKRPSLKDERLKSRIMQEAKQNLDVLTGIRFYAALHVVLYHNLYLLGDISNSIPMAIKHFIYKGESAVSFFFILSGFILTHVYGSKVITIKQSKTFFLARIAKLYPLYILAMAMDIPRVFKMFMEKYGYSVGLLKFFISAVASLVMLQSWIPNLTPVWNSPAWSLSCEIFFYFSFIFIIPFMFRIKRIELWAMGFYLIPVILFFSLKYGLHVNLDQPFLRVLWRSLPLLRLFEFMIGILSYRLITNENWKQRDFFKRFRSTIFWSCIFISILLTILLKDWNIQVQYHLFYTPLFTLIIMSSYFGAIAFEQFFTSKLILLLGGASYALYIIHQPFKYYFELFYTPSPQLFALYLLALIIASIFLFKFFERPLQKAINKYFS